MAGAERFTLTVSPAVIDLVKRSEGLRDGDARRPGLQPYICPAGYPTLGWGAIYDENGKRVTMAHPGVTLEQAGALLERDLLRSARAVARLCPVPLLAGQFGALVDFVFNLGAGNFQASTLRQVILRGDLDDAPDQFRRWVFSRGRKLPGLIVRREAEIAMWLS
jgi:lysozyme